MKIKIDHYEYKVVTEYRCPDFVVELWRIQRRDVIVVETSTKPVSIGISTMFDKALERACYALHKSLKLQRRLGKEDTTQ